MEKAAENLLDSMSMKPNDMKNMGGDFDDIYATLCRFARNHQVRRDAALHSVIMIIKRSHHSMNKFFSFSSKLSVLLPPATLTPVTRPPCCAVFSIECHRGRYVIHCPP